MDRSRHKQSTTFYCFSPEVMLATFAIEYVLAAYAFVRCHTTQFGRLVTAILLLLGTFQLAEYQICTDGTDNLFWAKLGLVAITFLPPLGYHAMTLIGGRQRQALWTWGLGLMFSLLFLFEPSAIGTIGCTGNYVIVDMPELLVLGYGLYYFGAILFALWHAYEVYDGIKKVHERTALLWLVIGYLSFLLPMAVIYVVAPSVREGVPSIMCGFAVILAIILGAKVLPAYHAKQRS